MHGVHQGGEAPWPTPRLRSLPTGRCVRLCCSSALLHVEPKVIHQLLRQLLSVLCAGLGCSATPPATRPVPKPPGRREVGARAKTPWVLAAAKVYVTRMSSMSLLLKGSLQWARSRVHTLTQIWPRYLVAARPPAYGCIWSPVLRCTALHCTALCCTVCTALHCTALCCTALCCTALPCNVLHCAALYCTPVDAGELRTCVRTGLAPLLPIG